MRSGARLGVDVGSLRVGVAASDDGGRLATPLTTLRRDSITTQLLARLVVERRAIEVVVGLPLSLSGGEGRAAVDTRGFATELADRVAPVPVRLVDERLSTISAERALRGSGARGGGRWRRTVIDQAAAVVILQAALDAERATGQAPGEALG